MDQVTVDFDKKTAGIVMKSGSALKEDAVAAALKKNGGFGISNFKEVVPAPKKARVLTVGLSGMT